MSRFPGAVTAHGLSYRYPGTATNALHEMDLDIHSGEYVLVCGASGSGKSTFCRALNGLVPHFHKGQLAGRLVVNGLDTSRHGVAELFIEVGLVFQNPNAQLFNSTVERELAFGLESRGLPRDEIRRRVAWAGELTGVEHLFGRAPHTLSGGEGQLVAIAAVLALRPPVLVLDEPFANLDPVGAARVRTALRRIHELGTTVIVAEHHFQHLLCDATRMVVLDKGRIVLDGTPRAVLAHDVEQFGLSLPLPVRLFRHLDRAEVPLTVEEAASLLAKASLKPLRAPATACGKPAGASLLETRDVTFAFDSCPALRKVNLVVREGECAAVVGANGSGKTTLIKHFNGLLRPSVGEVLLKGRNTRHTPVASLARHVGIVFQNPNDQLFNATVREELEIGPYAMGLHDPTWQRELVELFELGSLLDRPPYRLSEGQKKRVTFAAAMAARPEMVVLDEPTAGQDRRFCGALGHLLRQIQAEGRTVVLVTHDLEFAEAHTARWIVMNEGRLIADASPAQVMADHNLIDEAFLESTQAFRLAHMLGLSYDGILALLYEQIM